MSTSFVEQRNARFKMTVSARTIPFLLTVFFLLPLAACDSDPAAPGGKTSFLVRYEAEGACASIISVGYTEALGSTVGASITFPWSLERTIDTSAATPTTPAAVGLAVTCLGNSRGQQYRHRANICGR